MTARDIQRRLIVDRYRRSFVLMNYTPLKWWECDVFELTKAGFFREYEIKVSRSDFKADAGKCMQRWNGQVGREYGYERLEKHKCIGQAHGPSRFWFVVPENLITVQEVPSWAGLIYARLRENYNRPPWNILTREVKAAPRLHKVKSDPKVRAAADSVTYYRMHSLFLRIPEQTVTV